MKVKDHCPEFPFFGAVYPDATCIDGKLHDLDQCDENGQLYKMLEDIPCPFCREEAFLEYLNADDVDEVKKWIKETKEKYK